MRASFETRVNDWKCEFLMADAVPTVWQAFAIHRKTNRIQMRPGEGFDGSTNSSLVCKESKWRPPLEAKEPKLLNPLS